MGETALWHLFDGHRGRTIRKWPHYFPIYERHFAHLVDTRPAFIEIGCGKGGSLQMWRTYFGPGARIIGLDIRPECREYEEPGIHVRIGDQADSAFLGSVLDEFGPPDAVLDDGSHLMQDVTASFHHLYPALADRGVYMVEDLHTAYWPRFGGGWRRKGRSSSSRSRSSTT